MMAQVSVLVSGTRASTVAEALTSLAVGTATVNCYAVTGPKTATDYNDKVVAALNLTYVA